MALYCDFAGGSLNRVWFGEVNVMPTKRISIALGADGLGTTKCVESPTSKTYRCGGKAGYPYTRDLMLEAKEGIQGQCPDCDTFRLWTSAQGDKMRWSIKVMATNASSFTSGLISL